MARRSQSIIFSGLAILVGGGLISLTLVLAVWGLWQAGDGIQLAQFSDPYLWHILWFSSYQALISASLSLLIGTWLGRCLFYLKATGTHWWLDLASVCFVAPVILVVLGVVGAFGHNGIWSRLLGQHLSIYGLSGIFAAHLFLNIPLFIRHSYLLWQGIAVTQWQQAQQLGMSSWQRWRYLEWPLLRAALLNSFVVVFLLCFGSFTIVLALGGGPAYTTLEVAIYQALKYDFEPAFALACALLQLVIALGLSGIFSRRSASTPPSSVNNYRPSIGYPMRQLMRGSLLVGGGFFLSVIMGIFTALWPFHWRYIAWSALAQATTTSLVIAGLSWLCCVVMLSALSWLLRQSWHNARLKWLAGLSSFWASALLFVPPMVVSTGLFFWMWQRGYQGYLWPLVALVNAMMALPFASRFLQPALWQLDDNYRHLLNELALTPYQAWRVVYLPVLARPIALASAFALVLSLGDMGVVALLGDVDLLTLPLLIYQQLGHYQFASASMSGLWLLLLCIAIFVVMRRLGEKMRTVC
ncbi:ABC transporter permease subunit [Celerinatantimonas yamalensis]|uniref:ABC transporter permease subunit n=1 Tax=Celerinatantimonas yamalensis TaxID=559956 RepID=A0ABW9G5S6_9GAMM